VARLTGRPEPAAPSARTPLRRWLLAWIDEDADPRQEMDSLPGVMWHLSDAWARRSQPNVLLVHYVDLVRDLDGQMRRLARRLGITVPEQTWPGLVEAATFEQMRARAGHLVTSGGILKSSAAFFRLGSSGAARETLTEAQIDHYHRRVAQLAAPDMLAWLHSANHSPPYSA
jgi:aryl sulfotransferase